MTKEQITERLKQNEIDRQRLEEEKIKLEKQLKERNGVAYTGKFFSSKDRLIIKITGAIKNKVERTEIGKYVSITKSGCCGSDNFDNPDNFRSYSELEPLFGE